MSLISGLSAVIFALSIGEFSRGPDEDGLFVNEFVTGEDDVRTLNLKILTHYSKACRSPAVSPRQGSRSSRAFHPIDEDPFARPRGGGDRDLLSQEWYSRGVARLLFDPHHGPQPVDFRVY